MLLTFTTLWANSADDKFMIFSYLPQKTGFDIVKCQILFPGKNKENTSKCHLLKILPRVLSVNLIIMMTSICIFFLAPD